MMKLDVDAKRGQDQLRIFTEDILTRHEWNSREEERRPEVVKALAHKIALEGQQTDCLGRRIEQDGKKLVALCAGHGRFLAVSYINEHPEEFPLSEYPLLADKNGERIKLPLNIKVSVLNEEQGFSLSIDENLDREELSPMDIFYQQKVLRERYGWDEKRIADKYKMTQAYVSILKRFEELAPEVQQLIREGKASGTSLIQSDVVNLPHEEQVEVVQAAQGADGHVDTGNATGEARNRQNARGRKGKARNVKEIREFFEMMTGPGEPPIVQQISREMLKFIAGRIKSETMEARFRDIANGTFQNDAA